MNINRDYVSLETKFCSVCVFLIVTHIKLSVYKKSYRVTDKYTPNGALYKFMQNMQFFRILRILRLLQRF